MARQLVASLPAWQRPTSHYISYQRLAGGSASASLTSFFSGTKALPVCRSSNRIYLDQVRITVHVMRSVVRDWIIRKYVAGLYVLPLFFLHPFLSFHHTQTRISLTAVARLYISVKLLKSHHNWSICNPALTCRLVSARITTGQFSAIAIVYTDQGHLPSNRTSSTNYLL